MIYITNSNTKIGNTGNISLPPIKTCFDFPCHQECYAVKFYKMTNVKKSWDTNLAQLKENRRIYFELIRRYLLKKRVRYFRWHVSGDIIDQDYLERMKILAYHYYFTNFLVYTKGYHLDFNNTPGNLSIILSVWPGVDVPKKNLPLAFIKTKEETRIFNAIDCPGQCEECRICWNIKDKNIALEKH